MLSIISRLKATCRQATSKLAAPVPFQNAAPLFSLNLLMIFKTCQKHQCTYSKVPCNVSFCLPLSGLRFFPPRWTCGPSGSQDFVRPQKDFQAAVTHIRRRTNAELPTVLCAHHTWRHTNHPEIKNVFTFPHICFGIGAPQEPATGFC